MGLSSVDIADGSKMVQDFWTISNVGQNIFPL